MNQIYIIGKGKVLVEKGHFIFQSFEKNGKERVQRIPIKNVDQIICIGKVGFSPLAIDRIFSNKIAVLFFSWKEIFNGILIPRDICFPHFQIHQLRAYLEKREAYAKSIINGLKTSALICLGFYKNGLAVKFRKEISQIEISNAKSIQEILGKEAIIWKVIYSYLKEFFEEFEGRNFYPPSDKLNCLISFGNSLLYSIILIECIKQGLNPKIGFLHEIDENRNSLILDLSEIFKPFLILLLNFNLLLKKHMKEEHFDEGKNITYLNKIGKIIYLNSFDKFLSTTIYHFNLKRKISIIGLIRKEILNLKRSLISDKVYEPLVGLC